MPFPWALAFKVIPWSDVIAAAPGVARGAQKLWKQVARGEAATHPGEAFTDESEPERLARLESEIARLDEQVASQAELVAALAEQNQKLVEAVEVLRMRTRILGITALALVAGLLAVLAFG